MILTFNETQPSEAALINAFHQAIVSQGTVPPQQIIADGQIHRYSTSGKPSDTAGWYVLDLSADPHGAFGCWRSGTSQAWTPRYLHPILPAEQQLLRRGQVESDKTRMAKQQKQWAINAEKNKKMLAKAKPPGDEVLSYLEARGLGSWSIPACIRQHPGLVYWHQDERGELQDLGTYPVMLAPVVKDGVVVSVHRTYLCHGDKAPVPQPKKLSPASGLLNGGCIPLTQANCGDLGIAEGIETAAAASLGSGLPVVAAYCANAMAQYQWPRDIRRLVIFADNDAAGRDAALKLESRASNFGVKTKILTPERPGYDWADVWQEAQQ